MWVARRQKNARASCHTRTYRLDSATFHPWNESHKRRTDQPKKVMVPNRLFLTWGMGNLKEWQLSENLHQKNSVPPNQSHFSLSFWRSSPSPMLRGRYQREFESLVSTAKIHINQNWRPSKTKIGAPRNVLGKVPHDGGSGRLQFFLELRRATHHHEAGT